MPKSDAYDAAIALAIGALAEVDLAARCAPLGLPPFEGDRLRARMFGMDVVFQRGDFAVLRQEDGSPVKPADRIFFLHYLMTQATVEKTGTLISFREFPGGQFYLQPFRSRTTDPLLKRFGNDIEGLRANLDRFDWEPVSQGELGARIHVLGRLDITLVYHLGDEEFPPAADVLFDAAAKTILDAENAAVMASRICIGLL